MGGRLKVELDAYGREAAIAAGHIRPERVIAEMLGEIERLMGEVDRLRAALLAHCPNCCDIRWHHGQQRRGHT